MGYYTRFDLSFSNKDGAILYGETYKRYQKEILADLAKINPNYFNIDAESISELFEEELKWYDYEDDMKLLSSDFPDLIFTLYGEGEERDDNWVVYFHNGESEKCYGKLVYESPATWFGKQITDFY